MLRLPTLMLLCFVVSCATDQRTQRCDPYRTPRIATGDVPAGKEKSAHAPWLAGDCWACHKPGPAVPGETPEEARQHMQILAPANDRCATCHGELFRKPPRGHPPAQAFCTSCHAPHNSKQRSLLRDEDTSHACLDYPPPFRELAGRKPAAAGRAKP
jgi:predicted CXXCH cytochrome family protein